MKTKKKERIVQATRNYRAYHKYFGLALAVFLLISAVTGLLLGWKKDAAWIQPPTQKGAQSGLMEWRPVAELADAATEALYQAHPDQLGNPVDRLDVRPVKGIAKVLFERGYWEVQIDGVTGAVLSIDKRNSDFIEQLHDGSIISDGFKLGAMNIIGIGLTLMVLTGFWLWWGPRRIRAMKRKR